MKRKLTLILICAAFLVALCALFCVSASAETYSGDCGVRGSNVQWTLDTDTGVLEIAGTGNMKYYNSTHNSSPWYWDRVYIKTVTIGEGVTSIGSSAFYDCTSLTSVTIPDSVTVIGDHAFVNCKSLESITIPDSVAFISEDTFNGCASLKSITIPNSVTSIGDGAFWRCKSLQSITIPDSVTVIGDYAFYSCDNITSVTLGRSVVSIGYSAFDGCENLLTVTNNSILRIKAKSTKHGKIGYYASTVIGEGRDDFVTVRGKLNYYENEKIKTGWFVVDGKQYYGSVESGCCINSTHNIQGKQYFWNDETGLTLANGFLETDYGTICYLDGTRVIGWRHEDGSEPALDENGIPEQYSGSGKLYYFRLGVDSTSYMVTKATYRIGGFTREFNADHTVKPLHGLQKNYNNGETYYFINGAMQTGWQEIDGKLCYFYLNGSANGSGCLCTTSRLIGDILYEWNETTGMTRSDFTGIRETEDGSIYLVNGERQYGWQEIDGKLYYFYLKGSAYGSGYMCTTSRLIGDILYEWNETTGMTRSDFTGIRETEDGSIYLVNGERRYGWQQIGGNWYYFYAKGSSNGSGYMCTESRTIGGVWYEFDANGVCTSK